ncbi:MAG: DUF4097 domain-containing protein [Calditrichaceae bacterium]
MKRLTIIIFFVLNIILLTSLLNAATLEETFKKRVPSEGKELLILENKNGNIDIRTWDKNEIEIIAYKKVRSSDMDSAREMMKELEIEILMTGSKVEIITGRPDKEHGSSGFFSWLLSGGDNNYSINYEINVPEKLDLNIQSTNGSINLAGCEGRLRLETTNGNIKAEEVSGLIRSKTTNGAINASFGKVYPDDDMTFTSTNGSIKIYLPENLNADFKAQTTNGSINCELPVTEYYSQSKRTVSGMINEGGAQIYLKTTNGSIKLYKK